ncbi:MAG: phosphate ABC transporter permease PstA [Opitutaceae bacterium]
MTDPVQTRTAVVRTPGEAFVWLCSMGLALGLIMIMGLLGLIVVRGLAVFWIKPVASIVLRSNGGEGTGTEERIAGQIVQRQIKADAGHRNDAEETREEEWQLFVANKDVFGISYRFIDAADVQSTDYPDDLIMVERIASGRIIGRPVRLELGDGTTVDAGTAGFNRALSANLKETNERRDEIERIEKDKIGSINRRLEDLRLKERRLSENQGAYAGRSAEIASQRKDLEQKYAVLAEEARALRDLQEKDHFVYRLESGQERRIPTGQLVDFTYPNKLGFFGRLGEFFIGLGRFLSEDPREANTEGGIFPAIFGTFAMTLIMSVAVMPFGVIAAIYLREYARQGPMVRAVRISVNNLAGVPSIVFGVFGLGFFVYLVGGTIDSVFFADRLPTPTYGTGGIMWASLTLALLTLPVVIVATEEALSAVSRGTREASLACGASKWQTIQRIVLPASAPGILTGLILAMARGAGEVAPLMLVGVVKLAPTLPINLVPPFVHLDRKFMHLGFHIFDLGFQSPDAEAAKPMVFATTLLLILLVVVLNLGAILIRNHLRRKYAAGTF